MPLKLSALDGITDGISGSLHSTVDVGTSSSIPAFLHDGDAGQLVSARLDGSLAPIVAAAALPRCRAAALPRCRAAALLAADGVHLLRTRPMLALRALPV